MVILPAILFSLMFFTVAGVNLMLSNLNPDELSSIGVDKDS